MGLTIFLTSHFMDEVEVLCDQICILKRGKIVFYGTVATGCFSFRFYLTDGGYRGRGAKF